MIVPCWAVDDKLAQRMRALLTQSYADYEVVFAVGSRTDPAYPVLRELATGSARARVVVAGVASECSQQNLNMAAGAQAVGDAEVLAFADSDADFSPRWLSEMVAPLENPVVGLTTGLAWLTHHGPGVWPRATAWAINTYTITYFARARSRFAAGVSLAMRAETFRRLRVAEIWTRTACDDSPVVSELARRGLDVVFVPEALVDSPVDVSGFRGCVRWLYRQFLNAKVYAPGRYWPNALPGMAEVVSVSLAPLLALAAVPVPGLRPFALAAAGLLIVRTAAGAIVCRGLERHDTIRYAYLEYLGTVLFIAAGTLAAFGRRFEWAGKIYTLKSPRRTTVSDTEKQPTDDDTTS
ncbi:MAG: glycosyltransferase [Stackebrandtia sp.]